MVARSEDKPRTVTDRLADTSRRVDEAVRAQGRGAPALRDASGNVLLMNPDAPHPLLTPAGIDAAVAFTDDGTVKITSASTAEDRDMTVRDIVSSGEVHANRLTATGQVQADNVGCNVLGVGTVNASAVTSGTVTSTGQLTGANVVANNQFNAGGFAYIGGGLQVGAAEVPVGGRVTARECTLEGNLLVKGNIYCNGQFNPPSSVEMKRDIQPLPFDAIETVRSAPAQLWRYSDQDDWFIGPMAEKLPEIMQRHSPEGDGVLRVDVLSMIGVLWGSCSELYGKLQPLQTVADELPGIVAHSDDVHDALHQGQTAIGQAVAAVQQVAQSLTTALTGISQLAAQAYTTSAAANSRAAALEARVTALEARRVQTWRATGNLPTLALNATTTTLCGWQTVPSPLPTVDQCAVVQVAGTAATLTPTAVSAAGVTVSIRSANALLPATNALQVVAATW